jgi:hypothetical protein
MKKAPATLQQQDPHRALRMAAERAPSAELLDALLLAAAATAALVVAAIPALMLA